VYGDSKSINSVRALAAQPYVQWENSHRSEHRLAPTIRRPLLGLPKRIPQAKLANLSAKGNQLFAIQLVNDAAENAITLALIDRLKLEPIVRQAKVWIT
jgi:hypothetical protein